MLVPDERPGCWLQVSQTPYLSTGCLGFDQGWLGSEADARLLPRTDYPLSSAATRAGDGRKKTKILTVCGALEFNLALGEGKFKGAAALPGPQRPLEATTPLSLLRPERGQGFPTRSRRSRPELLSASGLCMEEVLSVGLRFQVSLQEPVESESCYLAERQRKDMKTAE